MSGYQQRQMKRLLAELHTEPPIRRFLLLLVGFMLGYLTDLIVGFAGA